MASKFTSKNRVATAFWGGGCHLWRAKYFYFLLVPFLLLHTAMLAERKLIGAASAAIAAFMHNHFKTKSNQKPMPFLCVKIKSLLPVRTERALRCCFTTKQRMELLLPKEKAAPKLSNNSTCHCHFRCFHFCPFLLLLSSVFSPPTCSLNFPPLKSIKSLIVCVCMLWYMIVIVCV